MISARAFSTNIAASTAFLLMTLRSICTVSELWKSRLKKKALAPFCTARSASPTSSSRQITTMGVCGRRREQSVERLDAPAIRQVEIGHDDIRITGAERRDRGGQAGRDFDRERGRLSGLREGRAGSGTFPHRPRRSRRDWAWSAIASRPLGLKVIQMARRAALPADVALKDNSTTGCRQVTSLATQRRPRTTKPESSPVTWIARAHPSQNFDGAGCRGGRPRPAGPGRRRCGHRNASSRLRSPLV